MLVKLSRGDRYFLERCANAAHFRSGPGGRIGQPLPFPRTPDPALHPALVVRPERVLALIKSGLVEFKNGARLTDAGRKAVGLTSEPGGAAPGLPGRAA